MSIWATIAGLVAIGVLVALVVRQYERMQKAEHVGMHQGPRYR